MTDPRLISGKITLATLPKPLMRRLASTNPSDADDARQTVMQAILDGLDRKGLDYAPSTSDVSESGKP